MWRPRDRDFSCFCLFYRMYFALQCVPLEDSTNLLLYCDIDFNIDNDVCSGPFFLSFIKTNSRTLWLILKIKGAVEQVSMHLSSVLAPQLHGKKLCGRAETELSAPPAHGESFFRIDWPLAVGFWKCSDGGWRPSQESFFNTFCLKNKSRRCHSAALPIVTLLLLRTW